MRGVALLSLLLPVAACKPQCTELGCGSLDGVEVTFARLPRASSEESFELSDGEILVRCGSDSRVCTLPSRHPKKIKVRRMERAKVTSERAVDVHYETVHPNGPACPGQCRFGRVAIAW